MIDLKLFPDSDQVTSKYWMHTLAIVTLRLARLQNPYQPIWVKCGLAETVKLGLSLADQCKCMHNEENPCLKADKDGLKLVKKQAV